MMNDANEVMKGQSQRGRDEGMSLLGLLGVVFRVALVAAILGGAGYVAYYWMSNRPVAQRRPPRPHATLVEVRPVAVEDARVRIEAMGTVMPSRTTRISAQVSGRIVEVSPSFVPGGRFEAGERVLQIESEDYAYAVAQREASLTKAEASLRLEMGQQAVAQREYELLGELAGEEDEDLLLRQPQLEATKAEIASARAALEEARLDLRRTSVEAPFNATVQERSVDLGAHVGPGTGLATLADTDVFWVEISVPVDDLRWVSFPDARGEGGSSAQVYHEPAWGPGVYREGLVVQLLPSLEPQGRMAQLLVEVADPLDLDSAPEERRALLLGSFARVEILGREMRDVVELPRTALHEGNRVWVMAEDNTLDVREVAMVWGGEDSVYVSEGLEHGMRLVVSDLAAPVPGMLLRTGDMPEAERGPGSGEGGGKGPGGASGGNRSTES